MILVTGAAGKTGQAVTRALVRVGASVRALVHKEEYQDSVESAGVSEIYLGDLLNLDDLQEIMEGVEAVYHICPNVHPGEVDIGVGVIQAAKEAGVEHFVYHSVLHPQIEAMPHHWLKLRVEEHLIESGLPFTILQPTAYMQNVAALIPKLLEGGVYRVPYPIETGISLVDLEDIAQAAAVVITEPDHKGATYELVGTGPITQTQVAAVLSEVLGKDIQAQRIPYKTWETQALKNGLGSYQRYALLKMFQNYKKFGFSGNSLVLGWLLGRQPTTLESCLRRELDKNFT
ncbi:MAG: NmrA family NAD(P)-binding protein [Anaerolineales bacterium]|nr:NmrA family NAD(P)-binding protein [Anaerolineales bacterium]